MEWGILTRGRVDVRRSMGRRTLAAAEAAWLMVLPTAGLVVAAIVLLGPSLGHLLFPVASVTPWPSAEPYFRPEPTEHARYLLALGAPVLLVVLTLVAARRGVRLRGASVARLVAGVQGLGVALVVVCIVVQQRTRFGPPYTGITGTSPRTVYFTLPTLLAAVGIAAAVLIAVRNRRVVARLAALARESRRRRLIAMAIVVAVVGISVLPAVNLEGTIATANPNTAFHVRFTFDEMSAVLNGRAPLVDFAAQYSSLWPYIFAAVLAPLGAGLGAFTILAATVTALAMLATFATIRRVARSAVAALVLFLPLLATSFYVMRGPLQHRYSLVNLTGAFPLRFAGPLLLLWLTARHLDRDRPRAAWPLFSVAALVTLNNGDFGLPALGATLAALLWAHPPSASSLRRLAAQVVVGLIAGAALVAVLTFSRAHSLPHLALAVRYARLFAVSGFNLVPIKPVIGMSTIIFLTYVAAIVTATVRALRRENDRLLTGLLAWSAVFGLGIGAYYVGRSHPEVLINMFPAWALSVVLLTVAAIRAILARATRIPSLPEAACLVGFGVLACSLAQTPAPWSEVRRLEQRAPSAVGTPRAQRFVAERTSRGEPVVLLMVLGHRIGANVGVVDVVPYTGEGSMPTVEQLRDTLADLRRAGGRKVFLPDVNQWPEIPGALLRSGFRRVAVDRGTGTVELVAPGMAPFRGTH